MIAYSPKPFDMLRVKKLPEQLFWLLLQRGIECSLERVVVLIHVEALDRFDE